MVFSVWSEQMDELRLQRRLSFRCCITACCQAIDLNTSVPDPYVFGLPRSGSVINCMDPDPSFNKLKN
jgi:hypothetical protein